MPISNTTDSAVPPSSRPRPPQVATPDLPQQTSHSPTSVAEVYEPQFGSYNFRPISPPPSPIPRSAEAEAAALPIATPVASQRATPVNADAEENTIQFHDSNGNPISAEEYAQRNAEVLARFEELNNRNCLLS